jgi:hypothetical protein
MLPLKVALSNLVSNWKIALRNPLSPRKVDPVDGGAVGAHHLLLVPGGDDQRLVDAVGGEELPERAQGKSLPGGGSAAGRGPSQAASAPTNTRLYFVAQPPGVVRNCREDFVRKS